MNQNIMNRIGNLLSVKSLVTLALTAVFAAMALKGTISQDFMTVYAVVIAFYFGTQSRDSAAAASSGRAELDRTQALDASAARSKVQDMAEGGGNGNG